MTSKFDQWHKQQFMQWYESGQAGFRYNCFFDACDCKEIDKKMRADLERIKKMCDEYDDACRDGCTSHVHLESENAILRELITSWQAMSANEYQTDHKLHLNMLTKRMLNNE